MMELAKRIFRLTEEQSEELQHIIVENCPEGIRTVVDQSKNNIERQTQF